MFWVNALFMHLKKSTAVQKKRTATMIMHFNLKIVRLNPFFFSTLDSHTKIGFQKGISNEYKELTYLTEMLQINVYSDFLSVQKKKKQWLWILKLVSWFAAHNRTLSQRWIVWKVWCRKNSSILIAKSASHETVTKSQNQQKINIAPLLAGGGECTK